MTTLLPTLMTNCLRSNSHATTLSNCHKRIVQVIDKGVLKSAITLMMEANDKV